MTTYETKNVSEMRAFLGLIRFYRRFIPDCSKITQPLNLLLRKDEKFLWWAEQKRSLPDYNQETNTDTSTQETRMEQTIYSVYRWIIKRTRSSSLTEGQEDRERVIAYASKGTNDAEANYEATKLECLAVKWAIGHFHHYLIGRHFTLITDHSAFQWLFKRPNPTGIYARWIMKFKSMTSRLFTALGKKFSM